MPQVVRAARMGSLGCAPLTLCELTPKQLCELSHASPAQLQALAAATPAQAAWLAAQSPSCTLADATAQAEKAAATTLPLTTGTASISVSGNNQNQAYLLNPVVQLSGSDLQYVTESIANVQAGAAPTAQQGGQFINTVQPNYSTQTTVPAPTGSTGASGATSASLAGFAARTVRDAVRMHTPRTFGAMGACAQAELSCEKFDISTGASIGTAVLPGIGTAIGAAVGAIVGLIAGLFGHKQSVPTVSQADVVQAQTWYQQYAVVSKTTVGRHFTASAIQDMITAEAILNPGFWGFASSTQIDIPAVNNFYNEVMTRVNDFMTAVASAAVGATISIHDDSSIPGHAGNSYHPNVTYTFISPGINAPSYMLGVLFAQYFYTMCAIFQSAGNCKGHLNPPMPQFYTDLIDYVRAGHAGWDTPQPNVIALICSVPAPTPAPVTMCQHIGVSNAGSTLQSVAAPPVAVCAHEASCLCAPPVVVRPVLTAVASCTVHPVCIPPASISGSSTPASKCHPATAPVCAHAPGGIVEPAAPYKSPVTIKTPVSLTKVSTAGTSSLSTTQWLMLAGVAIAAILYAER
jgi:hypothetical protein